MRGVATALGIAIALVALAGCQRDSEDGPLAVSGRMFVFNYRVAIASYLVTLNRNGDVPAGSVVETTFENPQGGKALVTRQKVFPNQPKLELESPPVHCVVKDRPYAVTIRLSDGKGAVLQTLETTVTSTDDQSIMPAKPLVVGPHYDRNPEVFKPDGTTDFSPETSCPK
ncbi:hypothetical protein [Rhizobium sp. RU36D]|uniref:hypothetical protein n=1 Tax=Rhizobium sp. RU36D TaxID=1907415 RepID=UPI0009D8ABE0|nr:hypothetical protein [Rhizobium sp. RU36D]SMD06751.1 hypothetical protein SAMN05880593_11915 [Rhizobium sp. RU36D]